MTKHLRLTKKQKAVIKKNTVIYRKLSLYGIYWHISNNIVFAHIDGQHIKVRSLEEASKLVSVSPAPF